MMEIPKNINKNTNKSAGKKFLILAGFGAVLLACILLNPTMRDKVKRAFVEHQQEFVATLKKEISNSGKLISQVNFRDSNLTASGIFSFTNAERAALDLPVFQRSSGLDAVAQHRLDDMFAEGYFEHVSPDGESASSEAEAVGYEYLSIGENIALGNFENDETLVQAWMDSPGHRANIVSDTFVELGVAAKKGSFEGQETWIAVQIFARPLSACPSVDSARKSDIEEQNEIIESSNRELQSRKRELDKLENDNERREEYEQKVEEYNVLVGETNVLIRQVEDDVREYNGEVRAFNACLDG